VIRVLIAEDMHMIRGALVALLSLEPDIEVVAELDRGDIILETALRTKPDVAVVDIDLPGLDGLSAADAIHQRLPECRTLVLTGLSQPGNLLRALEVHVRGFLMKDAPAPQLASAIRSVAAGRRVLDPELVAAAVETGSSPLTLREADVLRSAESGLRTDEIGDRLNLSPTTVRNYLSHAMAKLGARNRLDAIRIARHAGWL
jgi:two-component system, NarL family, response regulator DesR